MKFFAAISGYLKCEDLKKEIKSLPQQPWIVADPKEADAILVLGGD